MKLWHKEAALFIALPHLSCYILHLLYCYYRHKKGIRAKDIKMSVLIYDIDATTTYGPLRLLRCKKWH